MSHGHSHGTPESGLRLAVVVGLNFIITVAEIIGGLISNALHNFSDGIAVLIAWIVIRLNARPRTNRHTFSLKRAQVLAAVINAGALRGNQFLPHASFGGGRARPHHVANRASGWEMCVTVELV